MKTAKSDVLGGLASAASSPVFWWAVVGIGAIVAVRYILPGAVKSAEGAIVGVGEDIVSGVGKIYTATGDIVGHNSNQNPTQRTRADQVKGLLSADKGDRALSDLVDDPWQYVKGLVVGTKTA